MDDGEESGPCWDIDGLLDVRHNVRSWCGNCGRDVIWTPTGWHHVERRRVALA